jgi:two-component system, cell cycle sensor histidine kinase and response regulator CckA
MDWQRFARLSRAGLAPRAALMMAVAAGAYFAGARAGYALQIPAGIVTLWPPAGIMLGLLLHCRRSDWPAVVAGGLLASTASDRFSGYSIPLAMWAAVANLGESLFAAWILTRGGRRVRLDTLRGVLELVVGAVLAANALTAVVGALMLHVGFDTALHVAWLTWWVGDGLGMLIVAPVIIVAARKVTSYPFGNRRRIAEAIVLFSLLTLTAQLVLGAMADHSIQPGLYITFPLLLWASLRFGSGGAAVATLVVAFWATWNASHGIGPFVDETPSSPAVAWGVYSFLVVASLTSLVPAAIVEELRAAHAKQAESEARYRAVVHTATDAIIRIDQDSRIEFANAAVQRIFGYAPHEVTGRLLTDLIPEQLRDRHHRSQERSVAAGEPHLLWSAVEVTGLHRDGREVPLEVSFGETVEHGTRRSTGVLRDISEKRQAQAALRDAEERMRFALEASSVGVWEYDLTTGRVTWSPTMEALHGLVGGTFLGTFDAFLSLIHDEDRPEAAAEIERSTHAQTDAHFVYRTTWPDGSVHSLSGVGRTFHGPDGRPLRAAGIAMDVTDQLRLEAQVRQSQKLESLGLLAGGIAHDFNNLLTAIDGYGQLLRGSLGPEHDGQKDLAEILKAAERAAALTKQLLAFSRQQILEPRVLDLREVLQSIEPLVRRLIGEDIQVSTRVRGEIGAVRADPGQVEQVVLNLAINARDAMPEGGLLLLELANVDLAETYARSHIEVTPGSYVMLAVTDTGSGMSPELAQRIFDPFFTTKAAGKGTGLGLSTVYGIVKQSGGSVAVYSEPGHGSTFKVYFPRLDEPADADHEHPSADTGVVSEHILVVEDDEPLRRLAQRVLEQRGYEVTVAATPTEALRLVEEAGAAPDLLLTDVVLPEMSGRIVAERLVARNPQLRVLFMSGYTDDAVVRRGVLHGETHFLQKPFRATELLRKVREALESSTPYG